MKWNMATTIRIKKWSNYFPAGPVTRFRHITTINSISAIKSLDVLKCSYKFSVVLKPSLSWAVCECMSLGASLGFKRVKRFQTYSGEEDFRSGLNFDAADFRDVDVMRLSHTPRFQHRFLPILGHHFSVTSFFDDVNLPNNNHISNPFVFDSFVVRWNCFRLSALSITFEAFDLYHVFQ